ncbi:hypothetical protein NDU88_000812 [Pleurodeles waltl]|uniref:Uncharacterized protein n=1 Tax=Pleurodeles waltl TaxID=8319 RepID=A0AAV7M3I0_PLEWA|nr:hypothetical protein NDU88_000812 [Pleurodeles waltl]
MVKGTSRPCCSSDTCGQSEALIFKGASGPCCSSDIPWPQQLKGKLESGSTCEAFVQRKQSQRAVAGILCRGRGARGGGRDGASDRHAVLRRGPQHPVRVSRQKGSTAGLRRGGRGVCGAWLMNMYSGQAGVMCSTRRETCKWRRAEMCEKAAGRTINTLMQGERGAGAACTGRDVGQRGTQVRRGAEGPRAKEACTRGVMGHHGTQARSGAGPTGAEPACTGWTSGTAALKQVSRGEEGPRAKEACTRGVMGHHGTQARSGARPTGAEPACTGRTSGTAALKQVSRGEEGPRAKEACTRGVMGHHGTQVRRGAEGPRAKEACTRGVMGHHGTQVSRGAEGPRAKEACTRGVMGHHGTQVSRGAEGPRAKEACTRRDMGHHSTQVRRGAEVPRVKEACTRQNRLVPGETWGTAALKQVRRGAEGPRTKEACTRGVMGHHGTQVRRGEEGPRAKEACTRGVMGHHGTQVSRGEEGPRAKEACTRRDMGHRSTQVRRGAEVPRVKEACTRQNRLVPGETWGTAALKQVRQGAEGPRAKEACTRGVMGHHDTRSEERGRAHRSRAGLYRVDVGHCSTQASEPG